MLKLRGLNSHEIILRQNIAGTHDARVFWLEEQRCPNRAVAECGCMQLKEYESIEMPLRTDASEYYARIRSESKLIFNQKNSGEENTVILTQSKWIVSPEGLIVAFSTETKSLNCRSKNQVMKTGSSNPPVHGILIEVPNECRLSNMIVKEYSKHVKPQRNNEEFDDAISEVEFVDEIPHEGLVGVSAGDVMCLPDGTKLPETYDVHRRNFKDLEWEVDQKYYKKILSRVSPSKHPVKKDKMAKTKEMQAQMCNDVENRRPWWAEESEKVKMTLNTRKDCGPNTGGNQFRCGGAMKLGEEVEEDEQSMICALISTGVADMAQISQTNDKNKIPETIHRGRGPKMKMKMADAAFAAMINEQR